MFNRVRRVMNVLFVLFLLFIFIAPGAYLEQSCSKLLNLVEEAETALDPAEALDSLAAVYTERSRILRLFIDHAGVDAVGAAVAAARPLREREALDSALETVKAALEAVRRIERFGLEDLC